MFDRIKRFLIGGPLNPLDKGVFHNLSLVAFFAWVGLGSDGLSSSCYGPEEAFLALQNHPYLSIFVGLASAMTIFIISASYSQIIELFPTGGGGYLVASKLLSPTIGMISGCALLIDYLLTITISIASGTDALFSFFPVEWLPFKLEFAALALLLLIILNMRGVKESIYVLVPMFLTFIVTHAFIIIFAVVSHIYRFPFILQSTVQEIQITNNEIGFWGVLFLILRAYTFGAGTYTGIEVVSNGLGSLREPRVKTGKRTMLYMSLSLAFTVLGLMLAYLFYHVEPVPGKTLNAVLFETISHKWGWWGSVFVLVSLISEAMILFVAAQTGFLGGPRVLASMALDRWFSTKFASLSDRLVNQKGILLMGISAIVLLICTKGSVKFLVVLYSINVFITFCLSQLGMVRHWWNVRKQVKGWFKKLTINGIGLALTTFILISVIIFKFHEGGWITLVITGSLIIIALLIKRHYMNTAKLLRRLSVLVQLANSSLSEQKAASVPELPLDMKAKTAVIMVNGFNGLGLHTLFNVIQLFGKEFRNFVFVEIGVLDAGNFKGVEEVSSLEAQIKKDVDKYVQYMKIQGYHAEGLTFLGLDPISELDKIADQILKRYPGAVFFGGQLVFAQETFLTKWLHNFTVFAMQRKFYTHGVPFVVLPIRV